MPLPQQPATVYRYEFRCDQFGCSTMPEAVHVESDLKHPLVWATGKVEARGWYISQDKLVYCPTHAITAAITDYHN